MNSSVLEKEVVIQAAPDIPIIKIGEEESTTPKLIVIDEEYTDLLQKELMNILFDFYKSISNIKDNDLSKQIEYLEKIKKIKDENRDNKELNIKINEFFVKINEKIEELYKENELKPILDQLRKYIFDYILFDFSIDIDLSNINVDGIIKLYEELNNNIEGGDLKKITVARGRLIKLLRKEDKEINTQYDKVKVLDKINNFLSLDNPSLEQIRSILENEKDIKLFNIFKSSLTDLNTFKNNFYKEYNSRGVQQIIFLKGMLSTQLEKHKNVLNERYQTEFLDKKGTLPTVVTVLPNALKLSVQKLANSILELKEARTNRRKVHLIDDTMKSFAGVIGTPLIYFGKFLASNWYTLYMTHNAILKVQEEQQRIEEARQAEEAKKIADAKRAESLRREQEVKEEMGKKSQDAKDRAKERNEIKKQAEAARQAEKAKQAEAARRAIEARQVNEDKAAEKNLQKQLVTESQTEPETSQEALQSDPELAQYGDLRDTRLVMVADGREVRITDWESVDGNTEVEIACMPKDAKWYELWKVQKVKLPYKYVKSIWNFPNEYICGIDNLEIPSFKRR